MPSISTDLAVFYMLVAPAGKGILHSMVVGERALTSSFLNKEFH